MTARSNQWTSEVLASLLEYYFPPGEEGTAFFRATFTMRLPATIHCIQVHLAGTKLTDLKELAQLADRLWQCNTPQPVAAILTEGVQSDDKSSEVMAAMLARK